MAIAATVLLASGVTFGGREWLGASLLHAVLGDHQNCPIRFSLNEKPISLEEAAQRFEPAYRSLVGVAPSPARLTSGELTALERHSCVYHRQRFAHIVLHYAGPLFLCSSRRTVSPESPRSWQSTAPECRRSAPADLPRSSSRPRAMLRHARLLPRLPDR